MFEYQAGNTPIDARNSFPLGIFFLVLLIIALAIFLLYILISRKQKYLKSDEYKEKEKNRPTTHKDITKVVKENFLSKEQGEMLWEICSMCQTKNIIYQLKNNNELSDLFRNAYNVYKERKIDDQKMFDFFTLLYKMETIVANNKAVPSTKFIPVSTVIFYISETGEQYPFPLVKNTEDGFYLEIPEFLFNSPRRPKILTRSRFTFKTNQGLSYNLVARVIRYDNNSPEKFYMIVGHSEDLTSQVQRHFKRDYFERNCTFSPVRYTKNTDSEDSFASSTKENPGKLVNLSGGGCCIQTELPIKEGQNLAIKIPDLGFDEQIIGVIKKTRRLPVMGYAIHIQFLRISVKSQNRIFSLVYKYEI